MKGTLKMLRITGLLVVVCLLLIASNVMAQDLVSARAAVAIDMQTDRILYAKNPNYKQPPASTAKLVTAMVVIDRISMDKVIKVSDNAANTPTVSPKIRAGEHFTAQDLLYMTLMRSVNSAAVALAEAVAGSEEEFVELMNAKASQIGAENTRFANASGLPGGEQFITAFDLAKVMKEALKYPLIREIINTRAKHLASTEGRRVFLKNTNQLLWTDDGLLGGKTGYTKAAQHCFVSAAQKGDSTIIVAVLGETVRDNLWNDTITLVNKGYSVISGKEEPMIFFTNIQNGAVTLASYKRTTYENLSQKTRYTEQDKKSIQRQSKKQTAKQKALKSKKPKAKKSNKTAITKENRDRHRRA